ncbi:NACHT, LRR and PYD domains-containing protein 12 isoform X1 [Astyanax mexicanus]|uniref:NACHT, LRR and PYD domains-containing protein 12 isoform X1 n=1 Tax=Astyanax mexicanus TaxID=7994 RepID=UPI0020CB1D38|nr:NACHT, LRR and PYD domains-containing protein 12 isoform X1 [Astyanax mexicanus]
MPTKPEFPVFIRTVFVHTVKVREEHDDRFYRAALNTVKEVPKSVLQTHKARQRKKFRFLHEGDDKIEHKTFLDTVYTELHITERQCESENSDHEIWQIEREFSRRSPNGKPISCNDIFKPIHRYGPDERTKDEDEGNQAKVFRTVLTKGIAGIGKTVSVQKFILDWTEGSASQDVDLMIVMPFRELNLVRGHQNSLHSLIGTFNPELKELHPEAFEELKTVFVLDGLDEFRSPLSFTHQSLSDITEPSSVGSLIANLIKGNLLSSSCIWITSRPAAASQIPSQFIGRLTEVHGFSDHQKKEYFKKRIGDQGQADKIVSHIMKVRSLRIMCCIPVFCWITAITLKQTLDECDNSEIPKTLTELYIHFLLTQANIKKQKYDISGEKDSKKLLEANRGTILRLAELAFKQLMKHNVMFYEEDLRECGIDIAQAAEQSGFFTEILKEESVFYQRKVYCFVHLSFQEFLAAFYVFYCHVNKKTEMLNFFQGITYTDNSSLHYLLTVGLLHNFNIKNRHLDLFLRFLVGVSLESNQRLLQGLLMKVHSTSESIKATIQLVKKVLGNTCMIFGGNQVPITLFLCLLEMKDHSLLEFLKSEKCYEQELSVAHCSTIAYIIQTSEEVLDELDLTKVQTKEEGQRRLVAAAWNCRKALLSGCNLNEESCETLAEVLMSEGSSLRELDVSNNYLQDSGVKKLFGGLKSSNCKLQILRLSGCSLTSEICGLLGSALQVENSPLREVDLSNNNLLDSGVKQFLPVLKHPHCKLETLKLALCNISEHCCEDLASVLQSPNSHLKQLDLSNNDLQDSGVKIISAGLQSPQCKLEILKLSGCLITEEGCSSLASALNSNPSKLKELDLSYNNPGEFVGRLSVSIILNLDHGGKGWIKPGLRKYACELTMDPNTVNPGLSLSEENRKATTVEVKNESPEHPARFDSVPQLLCTEGLSGRCYWEAEYGGGWKGLIVAVAYEGIGRKGYGNECVFGNNRNSWSIACSMKNCCAYHNGMRNGVPPPPDGSRSRRLGVYLDWPAGVLSFYNISPETLKLTHLHTYRTTFTQPLFAGFSVTQPNMSVSLCQLE